MPRSARDCCGRVEQRPRAARLETREPRPKRRCTIRIADRVEDYIEGGKLRVFFVGGVVDRVLDTAVSRAWQQGLERHVARASSRTQDQDRARRARCLLNKNP